MNLQSHPPSRPAAVGHKYRGAVKPAFKDGDVLSFPVFLNTFFKPKLRLPL